LAHAFGDCADKQAAGTRHQAIAKSLGAGRLFLAKKGNLEMFGKKKPQPKISAYDQFVSRLDAAISDAIDSGLDIRSIAGRLEARQEALRARWATSAPIGQAW
jgi:hypothetical protein